MTQHQDTAAAAQDGDGFVVTAAGRARAIERMRTDAIARGEQPVREVRALRIDTDGHLTPITYRGREHHVLREHLGVRADAAGGVGLEALDEDLVMWFDEYGAEHQPINPTASVIVAAFGRCGEQMYGPVVLTGWTDTGATVLLAGMAASCDTPWVGTDRSGEWTGLGVYIAASPRTESFDALAWTITCDGDVPRCIECGEPGSHPEHQPEALAEQAEQAEPVVGLAVVAVGR